MLRRKNALGLHEAMHHEALHTAHGYKAKGNQHYCSCAHALIQKVTDQLCANAVAVSKGWCWSTAGHRLSTQTLQRLARLSLVACDQDQCSVSCCQAPRFNQPSLVELARSPSYCTTNAGSLDLQRFAYLSSEQPQSRDSNLEIRKPTIVTT